ncbi:TPA: hypothetical protein DD455_03110 [Candidatus Shapirobacteria bacterium]|nr:hypothetical protein [Candidatus Shapirobacteria bacterium]
MKTKPFTYPTLLLAITLLSSVLIWFGFYKNLPQKLGFPSTTLETVFANYDGPNYMVVAKCLYQKDCIAKNFSLPLPLEYYPAHLPGYPLLINYFSFFTTTPKAMLLATLFGSLLFSLVSFYFYKLFFKEKIAFWLAFLTIFFPARLFVLRLVGAPETWFLSFILLSIIFFKKKNFWVSAIFAVFSQLLKSPGILLFAAYFVVALIDYLKTKKFDTRYLYYLLIPASALGIFYYYFLQTGDFFAYFHSGDNFHLTPFPYQVFVSSRTWINTIWLEDVIYVFALCFFAVAKLWKKHKVDILFLFPFIFTLASIFVAHRDISRYMTPVYPFIFLAFGKKIASPKVRLIFFLLIPAVILYAINFIIGNTAPITTWAPYL